MEEMWKSVDGYEGRYEVSNLGRVRSLDRVDGRGVFWASKIRKAFTGTTPYLSVILFKDSKRKHYRVHRLVAIAFLPTPRKTKHDLVVDHIDGNKTNNKASNLRFVTQRQNCIFASKNKNGVAGVRLKGAEKNPWHAQAQVRGKSVHIGVYKTKELAGKAYMDFINNL